MMVVLRRSYVARRKIYKPGFNYALQTKILIFLPYKRTTLKELEDFKINIMQGSWPVELRSLDAEQALFVNSLLTYWLNN